MTDGMDVFSRARCCGGILCRYSEIATKGRNRSEFERLLVRALKRHLAPLAPMKVVRERGRIFLFPEGRAAFPPDVLDILRHAAPRVFGLASLSPGTWVAPELEAIEQAVLETFPAVYESWVRRRPGPDAPIRYAMRARRNNRAFPLSSTELEIHFAQLLLPRYPRLKVDLGAPELRVDVEVREDGAFISYERVAGPGGLPAGSGGRLVALLSGGIDSPVACYLAMRRGCTLHYVTFHSAPFTPPAATAKVARLVRRLNPLQYRPGRLYAVNLLEAQQAVRDSCNPRFRTVLYRRLMVRICAVVARAENALALLTGENLGQVASQTLENLTVIDRAAAVPILRPLLTFDKNQTTDIARRIGTYEISKEQVPDSCTVFAPDRPVTAATIERVAEQEGRLRIPDLVRACLEATVVVDPATFEEKPPSPRLSQMLEQYLGGGMPA